MTTYIYKVKTEDGYRYYEAEDAVMAMGLAFDDGYKQFKVVDVCCEDITIPTYVAFRG